MTRRLFLFFACLFLPLAAPAKGPPTGQGMVSAADPRATAAGAEILRAGGSAADAAIAMMLALNVVEPGHSGIGGGGFLLYLDTKQGLASFDGREAAPQAADGRWFYGPDGQPLSHGQAIPGGRSVGVPGSLRLMWQAHEKYGRLPWARLFQPAIRLARDGWAVSPRFYGFTSRLAGSRLLGPWARSVFYNADGTAKPAGTVLRNPEQAELLTEIAARGPDHFYSGAQAETLVATVNGAARNPSKMTTADLAAYRVKPRTPVCGTYRSYRICGMGPPASGGIAVLQILKQLERFDLAKLGKDSPVAWHLFAESSRLAYADRDAYLGDPDFVTVPVKGLIAPDYIAQRSALISASSTMTTIEPGKPAGVVARARVIPGPEHGTTDLVAIDRQGNVAEVTTTIESVFGSGLTTNGIFLNNELTDFDFVPDRNGVPAANRVEGGKRPRSSMSPTIVYDAKGRVRIALGAAGGSTIIAQVAKALIAVIDWKMSAQDAIGLGLLYAPGRTAVAEKATALEPMVPALQALGERVVVAPLGLKANAIERVGGRWIGAADPRSEGVSQSETGPVITPERAAAIVRPSE